MSTEALPQAIIFDLDDTILDDSGQMEACWRDAFAEFAPHLGFDPHSFRAAYREYADWWWSDAERHRTGRLDLRTASRAVVLEVLRSLGRDDADLAVRLADRYRDLREEYLALVPGAIETVEWFRSRGVRLGMATNGSAAGQRAKIERFGLAPYFDRIIVEGEFGMGKPHREVYEALFASLGVPPEKTWSVGDNLEWDVSAPQSLGAYGIWVDARRAGLLEGSPVRPDRVVYSVRELPGGR